LNTFRVEFRDRLHLEINKRRRNENVSIRFLSADYLDFTFGDAMKLTDWLQKKLDNWEFNRQVKKSKKWHKGNNQPICNMFGRPDDVEKYYKEQLEKEPAEKK